jgi:hypothetical protein
VVSTKHTTEEKYYPLRHEQKKTHKFGIELPTSINHARELDRLNKNKVWMEAPQKELFNIWIAFEVLEYGAGTHNGWNKVTGHIIWDVKMDFTRKARWILDGY